MTELIMFVGGVAVGAAIGAYNSRAIRAELDAMKKRHGIR